MVGVGIVETALARFHIPHPKLIEPARLYSPRALERDLEDRRAIDAHDNIDSARESSFVYLKKTYGDARDWPIHADVRARSYTRSIARSREIAKTRRNRVSPSLKPRQSSHSFLGRDLLYAIAPLCALTRLIDRPTDRPHFDRLQINRANKTAVFPAIDVSPSVLLRSPTRGDRQCVNDRLYLSARVGIAATLPLRRENVRGRADRRRCH